MGFIHYLTKRIIHFCLHVFWIFPVKKNRITLLNRLSFSYGDNLKYICEALYDKYSLQLQIIFPLKNKESVLSLPVLSVKPFSFKYFELILSSSVIITNGVGISYLPIRKKQIVINTWHGGGPYKKTGIAVHNNYWMKCENIMNDKATTYMLSSCEYFTKYEAIGLGIKENKCICSGMPRNDIFFKKELNLAQKVKNYYSIKQNEKLVLYAPTYRGSDWCGTKTLKKINIDYKNLLKSLEHKFGGDWRFALRLHPGLKQVEIEDKEIVNCSTYPDMQELLYAADLVITDYSSLMWDFSLSKKPCFIYADDLDEYERTRGFYMPSKQWPYPIARNNEELQMNIINFDLSSYQEAVKRHHKESGSYEQGNACEIVMKLIENHIAKE